MSASVGLQQVEVPRDESGAGFPMLVFYPSTDAEAEERLGPFPLRVAKDGALTSGSHRLVIVSHGTGGSPASQRRLGEYLAKRGYVAALPEHPGNNRNDNHLADTNQLLWERPKHIRRAAHWLFEQSPFAEALEQQRYFMVGHSIGAYTALAVAGGVPTTLAHLDPERLVRTVDVEPDPRLSALVLLAPATIWFRSPGALSAVKQPLLLIASYADKDAPHFVMCDLVKNGVPDPTQVEEMLVEDAQHYSFLSPWPAAMRNPNFPPSWDPPGFDRDAFLARIYVRIGDFLARQP